MLAIPVFVISLPLYVMASPPMARRARAELITACSMENTVALTFDDGPSDYMEDVVNTLKAAGGKGTFFLNGNNGRCIYNDPLPTYVKYAYDNGFQLGSHTWQHKDLTTLGRDEINQQMALTEEAIRRITGEIPAFMRPPYGNYNDLVLEVAGTRNQTVVTWDFDSQDSEGTSVATQEGLYDQAIQRRPKNILSLGHDVDQSTVQEVLPYAIKKLQAAGYKLVTLAECLGKSPYIETGSPVKPGGSQC